MAKNILADFDYDRYYDLLEWAGEEGIRLVHTHNYSGIVQNGGFSFAWRRASEFLKGRMVEVSVTFCSPRDTFCRKVGALQALSNFENGNTILVPVGHENSEIVVSRLRNIFAHAEVSQYI